MEPMVRALSSDSDIIVRRAAANAILVSLRPFNTNDAKTVASIAGANLQCVRLLSHNPLIFFCVVLHFMSRLNFVIHHATSCFHSELQSLYALSIACNDGDPFVSPMLHCCIEHACKRARRYRFLEAVASAHA